MSTEAHAAISGNGPTTIIGCSELLCQPCQQQMIADGWTVELFVDGKHALAELFDCADCRASINAAKTRHGAITIQALPDFTPAQYRELTAIHEAAHAVIGVVTGHPLRKVELFDRDCDPGVGIEATAVTTFGPYSVEFHQHAAMCWAGQQASLRWLAGRNLDTRPHRLGVRMLGWHDIHASLKVLRSSGLGLPADPAVELRPWRIYADRLLDEHWPAVITAQRDLLRHGHLDAHHIDRLIHTY